MPEWTLKSVQTKVKTHDGLRPLCFYLEPLHWTRHDSRFCLSTEWFNTVSRKVSGKKLLAESKLCQVLGHISELTTNNYREISPRSRRQHPRSDWRLTVGRASGYPRINSVSFCRNMPILFRNLNSELQKQNFSEFRRKNNRNSEFRDRKCLWNVGWVGFWYFANTLTLADCCQSRVLAATKRGGSAWCQPWCSCLSQ